MEVIRKITLAVVWAAMIVMCFLPPFASSAADTGLPDKTVMVQIPVSCVAVNTSETFQYLLSCESTTYQIVESDTLSLKDGEEGSFFIFYTYPGTYHYTVSQKEGMDSRTSYDGTVYTIDVYVTEDDTGIMSAEPVIYVRGEAEKKAKLEFVNEKEVSVEEKTSVRTGDTAQTGLWIAGLLVPAILIVTLAAKRERGARKNERS